MIQKLITVLAGRGLPRGRRARRETESRRHDPRPRRPGARHRRRAVEVTSICQGRENVHSVRPAPSHLVALSRADVLVQHGLCARADLAAGPAAGGAQPRGSQPGQPGFVNVSEGWEAIQVPADLSRQGGDLHPLRQPAHEPRPARRAAHRRPHPGGPGGRGAGLAGGARGEPRGLPRAPDGGRGALEGDRRAPGRHEGGHLPPGVRLPGRALRDRDRRHGRVQARHPADGDAPGALARDDEGARRARRDHGGLVEQQAGRRAWPRPPEGACSSCRRWSAARAAPTRGSRCRT